MPGLEGSLPKEWYDTDLPNKPLHLTPWWLGPSFGRNIPETFVGWEFFLESRGVPVWQTRDQSAVRMINILIFTSSLGLHYDQEFWEISENIEDNQQFKLQFYPLFALLLIRHAVKNVI